MTKERALKLLDRWESTGFDEGKFDIIADTRDHIEEDTSKEEMLESIELNLSNTNDMKIINTLNFSKNIVTNLVRA